MPTSGIFSKARPVVARHRTNLQPIQEEEERKSVAKNLQEECVEEEEDSDLDIEDEEDVDEEEEEEESEEEDEEVGEEEGHVGDILNKNAKPPALVSKLFTIFNKRDFNWKKYFTSVYVLAVASYLASITLENRTYDMSLFLFHRGLAVLYFISFWSIRVQILGLCGEKGILPVKETIIALQEMKKAWYKFPTLFWYKQSDEFIMSVCWCGLVCSTLYFFNILPTLVQAIAFICFLSFKTAGREFFALQFDNLLLDTSMIAILLPPISFLPFFDIPTSYTYKRSVLWLARWLQFRLMLGSGLCKITSGDKVWENGTALQFHYWSQPMPSWVSYYANRQPVLLHKISCYYHFVVELMAPFGVFFPPLFLLTFLVQASLQVGILITGNYGTFNLLSILLPFTLLDDSIYPPFATNILRPFAHTSTTYNPIATALLFVASVGLVASWMAMSIIPLAQVARGGMPIPKWVAKCQSKLAPFGLMNYYGLFARMTTTRRDIVIEGSFDGEEWKEYELKYKPGDLKKCPQYVIGHLPRLDWRMWFCQFSVFNYSYPGWFDAFLLRLLQGSPQVLNILEKDPFDGKPAKYLRCFSYEYRFASPQERKKGFWWTRSQRRLYWPPCTLNKNGKLAYLFA